MAGPGSSRHSRNHIILLPGKQKATLRTESEKTMKKWFLPILLVLVFCYEGQSWGITEWITDISKTYLTELVKKCGQSAVRGAIEEACETLGMDDCRKAAEEVRNSYSNYDIEYVCKNIGSMLYKAAKKIGSGVVQLALSGMRTTNQLLGYGDPAAIA